MTVAFWSLLLGLLLIAMVLAGTLLSRFFVSSAMIYLGVGYLLGPQVLGLIMLDPIRDARLLGQAAEVAVLISLFSVGLKLGSMPLRDARWRPPLRLASVSMLLSVGLVTAAGVWGLGLSLGGAVLLGAILAPTDPVLASGVQGNSAVDPDRLRFSLAGEGGLNDGTAFPFVMLGLGLLGLHELGNGGWRWWLMDLAWPTAAGLFVGTAMGALLGKLVVHLRTRHQQAMGLDAFLSLGLIAVAYGGAQLLHGYGFLAVFAAGLALQRVREQPRPGTRWLADTPDPGGHSYEMRAAHSHHASEAMSDAVQGFNQQLEKLAEMGIVLLVGAVLSHATPSMALWWFVPLMFVVLRPLAVSAGLMGEAVSMPQRAMICWFGIRGIGSMFYLMFAIGQGLSEALAQQLLTITLVTIAASIVVHGVSVRPLMRRYRRRKLRPA